MFLWVLHAFNRAGEQPFDGTYEGEWQRLVPGQTRYRHRFLAAGPNGNRYASPPLEQPWEAETVIRADGWVALLALPLETFGVEAQNPVLRLRVGRVYRAGEARQESTPSGASLFNLHDDADGKSIASRFLLRLSAGMEAAAELTPPEGCVSARVVAYGALLESFKVTALAD